ncbi:hypothetical protein [Haloarcula nitratireducens]|uniref:Uncharacterized protein n=1 Tax=Haloarcula nitratireducens TaxID=2487749 RepID=A0AAW4PCN6_9EURY|nr:hypothetical protein [Halomicroarcula nitratireducens]MBX0295435.1 hypothetical protein [Halomicroarcula nitratireducens]
MGRGATVVVEQVAGIGRRGADTRLAWLDFSGSVNESSLEIAALVYQLNLKRISDFPSRDVDSL